MHSSSNQYMHKLYEHNQAQTHFLITYSIGISNIKTITQKQQKIL